MSSAHIYENIIWFWDEEKEKNTNVIQKRVDIVKKKRNGKDNNETLEDYRL